MRQKGPIIASGIVATIVDAHQFRAERDLAAWLGVTPLNKSCRGKGHLGKIIKKAIASFESCCRQHDVVRRHGEALTQESRPMERQAHPGQAVPADHNRDGEQESGDHLGHANE